MANQLRTVVAVAALGMLGATLVASPAQAAPTRPDPFAAAAQASTSASARAQLRALRAPAITPVLRGLNNPRQLSLSSGGLLVGEAGRGGTRCSGTGAARQCAGNTSSVAWVVAPQVQRNARPYRVVNGLVSIAGPDGSFASGASAVSARWLGAIYTAIGYAPENTVPAGVNRGQLGKLLVSRPYSRPSTVANIAAYERRVDPDRQGVESNPYAALALADRVLVADAAGNSIVQWRNGRLSTFAVLPNITTGACKNRPNDRGTKGCDAVPTGLALGPNGNIYVSGLGSEAPGAGRVWELNRQGRIVHTHTGLTAATGVAVAPDGTVYASQLFTRFGNAGPDIASGKLTRIRPNGNRASVSVPLPAGVAVDANRNVYVSAWSTSTASGSFGPGTDGQVWRMRF